MDILKDEESMRRFLEVIESGDPIKDFYDEDDLVRVTGVDADSSREIEWRRIRGGPLGAPAAP